MRLVAPGRLKDSGAIESLLAADSLVVAGLRLLFRYVSNSENMKAEQTTCATFRMSQGLDPVEVQITIGFELAADEAPDVSIELSYEPKFPQGRQAQEELHQKLFNGVHAGLASVELPLPETGLEFDISQLKVSPPLQEMTDEDVQRLGNLLQELVRWAVAALWTGSQVLKGSDSKSSTAS